MVCEDIHKRIKICFIHAMTQRRVGEKLANLILLWDGTFLFRWEHWIYILWAFLNRFHVYDLKEKKKRKIRNISTGADASTDTKNLSGTFNFFFTWHTSWTFFLLFVTWLCNFFKKLFKTFVTFWHFLALLLHFCRCYMFWHFLALFSMFWHFY